MGLMDKLKGIPPGAVHLGPSAVEDLVAMLTYWYGIEADRWINSEASSYQVTMRVYNFFDEWARSDFAREFPRGIEEYRREMNIQPLDGEERDFTRTHLEERTHSPGGDSSGSAGISRRAFTCRVHMPLAHWLYFTGNNRWQDCIIDFLVEYRSFGNREPENRIRVDFMMADPYNLAITGFANNNNRFVDYWFLQEGLLVFREIEEMIREKHREGDLKKYFTYLPDNWIMYPCETPEDAMILEGICQGLKLPARSQENFVKFQLDSVDLPGLISYFRWGLPQGIFNETGD